MKLSREEVKHLALLVRMGLSEEDTEKFREQLSNILDNFQALQEVDTEGVPPTAQSIALQNVFREDDIAPSFSQEQILANAPQQEDGSFKIKAVLE